MKKAEKKQKKKKKKRREEAAAMSLSRYARPGSGMAVGKKNNRTDFPIICQSCIGSSKYIRMVNIKLAPLVFLLLLFVIVCHCLLFVITLFLYR